MAGNATFTIWNRMGGTLKSESYYTSLYEFGNTRFRGTDSGTGNALAVGTKHMHSGKWYFEFLVSGSPAGGWPAVGLIASTDVSTAQGTANPQFESIFAWVRSTDGKVKAFGGTTSATYGTSGFDMLFVMFLPCGTSRQSRIFMLIRGAKLGYEQMSRKNRFQGTLWRPRW